MEEELDSYFTGKLSDSEKRMLLDKIEANTQYKTEFIRMQNLITLSKLFPQKGDNEQAREMLYELNRKKWQKHVRHTLWNISKYCAIIILSILSGTFLMDKVILPVEEPITYTTIDVPKAQRVCMTLPDGTEAWLSPRSILRIPDNFNNKERSVELDGEGYFSITSNPKKIFTIQTKKHTIKVLGARFQVNAYSESSRFETELIEGKVEIVNTDKPEEIIELQPGEKLTYADNNCIISVSQFNNEEYLKSGIFSFSNKPFSEILEYLSLWYKVKFNISDRIDKDYPVSGKFRQSDEVKNVLNALQDAYPFKYKVINDEKIELYK